MESSNRVEFGVQYGHYPFNESYDDIEDRLRRNGSARNFYDWPPEILEIFHPFWQQFPQLPHSVHVVIGVFMIFVALVAVVGNTLVIFIFIRFRSLRTPGNLLVANLAFSDLMMALTGFPLYAASSFYGMWLFSKQVCKIYGFLGASFGLMSINSLASIALDRYLVIVRSSFAARYIEWTHVWAMIAIVWLNSIAWSVPPLFGWNRYILEGMGTTCSFDYLTKSLAYRSFILGMFFGGFIAPLLIIITCYWNIFKAVHNQQRNFRRDSGRMRVHRTSRKGFRGSRRQKEYNLNVELKTAKTAIVAVVFYCIAWTPYAIVSLIGEFGDAGSLSPLVSTIPCVFAKMSTMYNPFLYSLIHPRFRQKVTLLIKGREYPSRLRRQLAHTKPRRISDKLKSSASKSNSSGSRPNSESSAGKTQRNGVPGPIPLQVQVKHRSLLHQTSYDTTVSAAAQVTKQRRCGLLRFFPLKSRSHNTTTDTK